MIFFYGIDGLLPAVIVGILHFFIDYLKKLANPYFQFKQSLYFIIDQTLHLLVIFIASLYFYQPESRPLIDSQWILVAISLIITFYVGSVMVKFVLYDLRLLEAGAPFFKKNERPVDGIITMALFSAFNFAMTIILMVLASTTVIYLVIQQRLFKYSRSTIAIKYTVLLAVAFFTVFIGKLLT